MVGKGSHGRGRRSTQGELWRRLAVGAAIVVPVAAALGGSFALGREIFRSGQAQARMMRIQEVRAQSRLLLENVWASLENVKENVRAHASGPRTSAVALERGILSVTPFRGQPDGRTLGEIRRWGIAVLPSQASQAGTRLVFPADRTVDASSRHPELLVAQVDATKVFSSFSRWSTRREGGSLRGYLIGPDGRVLVHSERVYTGSNFTGTEVFQKALRSLFHGQRVSGIETFTGADLRPVLTSYVGVGTLPLAVVVERVVRPVSAVVWKQNAIPGALLVATLLLLCGLSYACIRMLQAPARPLADLVVATGAEPAIEPALAARLVTEGELSFTLPEEPVPESAHPDARLERLPEA